MEKNLRRAMLSCAGCTLMLFVTCGLAFNVFSAAQPYVLAQNGFTNTQTSLITTIRSAAYLLGTFAIGRYYRRLGYRTGCALAAMLACVSFLLFAAAKSLAAYYFAGAVAGVSYALGSMVPASILMRRWFRAHSGLAIGICSAGTGLATVVFSPLFTALRNPAALTARFYGQPRSARQRLCSSFSSFGATPIHWASSRGEQLFRRVRSSARCTSCTRPGCAGRCFCWPFCWSAASARRALPI